MARVCELTLNPALPQEKLHLDELRAHVFLGSGGNDEHIEGWYLNTDATSHMTERAESYFNTLIVHIENLVLTLMSGGSLIVLSYLLHEPAFKCYLVVLVLLVLAFFHLFTVCSSVFLKMKLQAHSLNLYSHESFIPLVTLIYGELILSTCLIVRLFQ
jgi:hypothetical protein